MRAAWLVTALLAAPTAAAQTSDAGRDEAASPSDEVDLSAPEARPEPVAAAPDAGVPEGEAPSGDPLAATEVASLTGRQCLRALTRAGVAFERVHSGYGGVATPVYVTGPVAGVTIRASRRANPREPMDCLLALALVRFSRMLRALHVREVRHLSVHRAGAPGESRRHPVLPRHPGGLAIDASTFVLDDGTEYDVHRDFQRSLGAPVCGPTARVAATPGARFLRGVFCDAARRGHFHVLLSPNFNEEHHNHFHLEVTRSVTWQYVR